MARCHCRRVSMGAEASFWTLYKPAALYSLLVDKWEVKGLLPRAVAVPALGKWVYYFQKGSFRSDPAGRKAASEVIAADIFKETGIRPPPSAVFTLLQNANAYLFKESNLPAGERGLMSVTEWGMRKLKRGAVESGQRVKETAETVKDALTLPKWLTSPWTFGAVGVLLVAAVAKDYIPRGRRTA